MGLFECNLLQQLLTTTDEIVNLSRLGGVTAGVKLHAATQNKYLSIAWRVNISHLHGTDKDMGKPRFIHATLLLTT